MPEYKLISADSHVNETPKTWEWAQKKHGDLAPRVVWNPSEHEVGPFGAGFPAPRWLGRALVESVRVHKERHVGLRLRQDGVVVDAIAFDQARLVPALGVELAFVFAPSLDVYRGETRVRVVIERMWPTAKA